MDESQVSFNLSLDVRKNPKVRFLNIIIVQLTVKEVVNDKIKKHVFHFNRKVFKASTTIFEINNLQILELMGRYSLVAHMATLGIEVIAQRWISAMTGC